MCDSRVKAGLAGRRAVAYAESLRNKLFASNGSISAKWRSEDPLSLRVLVIHISAVNNPAWSQGGALLI